MKKRLFLYSGVINNIYFSQPKMTLNLKNAEKPVFPGYKKLPVPENLSGQEVFNNKILLAGLPPFIVLRVCFKI